jgi:hypothetical protein
MQRKLHFSNAEFALQHKTCAQKNYPSRCGAMHDRCRLVKPMSLHQTDSKTVYSTFVETLEELFAEFRSWVIELTVALSFRTAPAAALTCTVIVTAI